MAKLLSSVSLSDQENMLSELLSQETPDSSHFASCVKTAFSSNQRVREMSAAYLVMHAAENSELSLMLVNSIQRMLSEANPLVRANALHLSAAVKAPAAAPILAHLLATACADHSPLVRIACFQSIGSCKDLDPTVSPGLLNMLVSALSQQKNIDNPEVGGWGLAGIALYWPSRLDAVHALFLQYVDKLPNFEPFCQVLVLKLFLNYCLSTSENAEDSKCQRLFKSALEMLDSIDNAVVIEAANVVATLKTEETVAEVKRLPEILLALPTTPLVCSSILQLGLIVPFDEHRSRLILHNYPPNARTSMLKLAATCTSKELSSKELDHLCFALLVWHDDIEACKAALTCITRLLGPKNAVRALKKLARLASKPALGAKLRSVVFQTIRVVVQQHDLAADENIFNLLAQIATDEQVDPKARAAIISLVSQNCAHSPLIALEILRRLTRVFALQSPEVRLQTLTLAGKLMTIVPDEHTELTKGFFQHILSLTRYDESVEIRDRARTFSSLESKELLLRLMLVADKPAPVAEDPAKFSVDTASGALGYRTSMYTDPPAFGASINMDLSTFLNNSLSSQELPDSEPAQEPKQERVVNRVNKMSLDEFLGGKESSSSSGETDSSDESSGESESDSDKSDSDSNNNGQVVEPPVEKYTDDIEGEPAKE